MARASLTQDGFQQEGFWEVGRLLPVLAPPEFSWLVFGGSAMLLIGTSCCETTQASSYQLSSYLAKAGGFGQWLPNPTSYSQHLVNTVG